MSDREMSAEEIFKKLQKNPRSMLDELPKDKCGIYALFNHADFLRYIGRTVGKKSGFNGRIQNHINGSVGVMKSKAKPKAKPRRHKHMFSAVYCCGRMWSYSKRMNFSPKEGDADKTPYGNLAKRFRNSFSREYCTATYVSIPRLDAEDNACYVKRLRRIEKKVQSLANIAFSDYLLEHGKVAPGPVDLNEWEGDFEPGKYQKYTEKLDELVNKLLGSKEKLLKKTRQSKKGFTEAEICKLPEALDHQNELYKKY